MILDNIANHRQYECLNRRFKTAFKALLNKKTLKLAAGIYELDGRNVYLSVYEGKAAGKKRLESHKKYIDIQYVVNGEEVIGWENLLNCKKILKPYSKLNDITFFKEKPACFVRLKAGDFVVFYPPDAHAPLYSGSKSIKKIVAKIKIS